MKQEMLKEEKHISYILSISYLLKKKVAAKDLYRASLLNIFLQHSMEQREDSCFVSLHPGLNMNLFCCTIRTEENMFFPLSHSLQRISWRLLGYVKAYFWGTVILKGHKVIQKISYRYKNTIHSVCRLLQNKNKVY